MNTDTLLLIGAVVAAYLVLQQAAGTPAPLSIYPEYAYLGQTSMAQQPGQKASTTVQPQTLYTYTQQQNQWALQTQCAGSYPSCTPLMGDTQLGL